MKFADTLELMNLVGQVDANMTAYLETEGKSYELEYFSIGFSQPVDYKGQPQAETQGGKFSLSMLRTIDEFLFTWSNKVDNKKTGAIVFRSGRLGEGQTAYKINFEDAQCVSLSARTSVRSGTEISLTISPRLVDINEIELDNEWQL
ncbi:MAG: type VI secretion system tube protein TssD [Bacteroidales bacterium]